MKSEMPVECGKCDRIVPANEARCESCGWTRDMTPAEAIASGRRGFLATACEYTLSRQYGKLRIRENGIDIAVFDTLHSPGVANLLALGAWVALLDGEDVLGADVVSKVQA